ncbi:sigma 54-interacting transcriptional regulator [Brevibacillus sp. AY1]|uniref:sigma-54-dependent Fis family transcriptional regulator n=1 Tax=Brevibacillus sp. AY1 TaxID=2807621 RepID=UPI002456F1AD|nr:sigma 54-interacting transcriptional regulator [Brevibacillus sp. AY1]MDH4617113.1 sigma 54-interacting transcriptional regulator [Brevibacillus sp. AY1]
MPLREIQESVQQIAEAVASVLRVEVEIADHHLLRIAGTGQTQPGVLRTMAGEDHVYRSSLFAGQPVVITHPGEDDRCKPCMHYGNCAETGEICCPIQMDGKNVGVIGLLAFDPSQRERLFTDVDSILNFLQKIAELIASKLKEHLMYVEQQLTLEKLRVLMDELDKAMLIVDQSDRIVQANQRARQYLQLQTFATEGSARAKEWITAIRKVDSSGITPKKVMLAVGEEEKEFLFAIKPIQLEGTTREWVITIDDVREVVEIARQVGGFERQDAFSRIVGNSPAIAQAKEVARRVADSESTVLLYGESGTGKELFAKAVHQESQRRNLPFVSINCAAIPEHLLESELFGYEDGSFTGARRGGKIGLLEAASRGTIFLDEIGDMPLHVQGKLLRVLQEREIMRVGSTGRTIPLKARIIAATHHDLRSRVEQGAFRMDLFYRLYVIPIFLPSLKERREDILIIANDCLQRCSQRLGKNVIGFSQETQAILFHYDWPGNVRELANAIEYAVNMETSALIETKSLPLELREKRERVEVSGRTSTSDMNLPLNLKELERAAIQQALSQVEQTRGRKEDAAEWLGISRATLFRKIKEYGLS